VCNVVQQAHDLSVSRRRFLSGAGAVAAGTVMTGAAGGLAPAKASGPPERQRRYKPSKSRTRLVLLGTGAGPVWWPNTHRQGFACAVAVENDVYLVDCGEGVGQRYRQASLGPDGFQHGLELLQAVFITHLHSDHTIDYPNLPVFGWTHGVANRSKPIQVYGPGNRGALPPVFGNRPAPPVINPSDPTPGIEAMTEYLYAAFATDINDRMRDSGAPDPHSFLQAHDIALPPGAGDDPNNTPSPPVEPFLVHEDSKVRVTATLVDHAPMFPAFGFRFDTDDGSITISGDTNANDNLIRLAQGTDVLVHEVIDREWVEGLFGPPPLTPQQGALVAHLLGSHTTIEEVGPVAEAAGAHTLVLSHLAPTINPTHRWRRAGRNFSGRLIVGDDLMQIGVGSRRRK
jgi:ribonuclease BN (tRNA processing enzyme)